MAGTGRNSINGRAEIVAFLTRKWQKELDYRLIKELWAFTDNRIAVRFAYEWYDAERNWFRSYGNENWEFDAGGVMQRRFASINDLPIDENRAGSTIGRWVGGLTITRLSPIWASDPRPTNQSGNVAKRSQRLECFGPRAGLRSI